MGMFSKAPSAEVIGAGLAGAGMARIVDKAGFKVTVCVQGREITAAPVKRRRQ
ncbi:hypothetical protein T492DRAFT_1110147, partial [Pavlovales sp. CCMP2436]